MKDTEIPPLRRLLLLAMPMAFAAGLLVMGLTLWLLAENGLLVTGPATEPASESVASMKDAPLSTLPIGLQNELDYLREEIEFGRERMRTLEDSIGELAGREGSPADLVAGNTRTADRDGASDGGSAANGGAAAERVTRAEAEGASAQAGNPEPARREYDRLVAAGIDAQTASLLQSRVDQQELARLDLIDQASREGWSDSDEFEQRLEALDATGVNLREELGEDDYDRYLFESGRSNRVGIDSVITGSAADQAGLQAGDQLVAYADNRVFGLRELQGATREGERGDIVQVVVLRNGSEMVVSVPRGPLGITLRPQRIEP